MDLFGIDADHRGGRRRWARFAWPLLGGLVGALLGVLTAPPLVDVLPADIPAQWPWLLLAAIALSAGVTMIAFMFAGRLGSRPEHEPQARQDAPGAQALPGPRAPGR